MKVFGFDLKLILALQLRIHTRRTVIVTPDSSVSTSGAVSTAWNGEFQETNQRYLFAKIGSDDAVVYPRILPGSVVRADRHYSTTILGQISGDAPLWLVEHPGGLTCCYVKPVDHGQVLLLPKHPPLSGWPLSLSREARILGLVDLEFRPRTPKRVGPICHVRNSESLSTVRHRNTGGVDFSTLLRISRARSGLTLREAHEMSMRIARLVGNHEYGIALGLLSDYEAMNKVPRHVGKIMSLCIIYGVHLYELAKASQIHIDDSDKVPLVSHDRKCGLPLSA